jgi:hypothetical protein
MQTECRDKKSDMIITITASYDSDVSYDWCHKDNNNDINKNNTYIYLVHHFLQICRAFMMTNSIEESFCYGPSRMHAIEVTMGNLTRCIQDIDEEDEESKFGAAIWHYSLGAIDRHWTTAAAHDRITRTLLRRNTSSSLDTSSAQRIMMYWRLSAKLLRWIENNT